MLKYLGPCTHMEDLDDAPLLASAWLNSGHCGKLRSVPVDGRLPLSLALAFYSHLLVQSTNSGNERGNVILKLGLWMSIWDTLRMTGT